MKTSTINTDQVPAIAPAYNNADRNAWIFVKSNQDAIASQIYIQKFFITF